MMIFDHFWPNRVALHVDSDNECDHWVHDVVATSNQLH